MLASLRNNPPAAAAAIVLLLAAATIAGAFIFEALGYPPCELCLKERIPYYAGMAVAVLALIFAAVGSSRILVAAVILLALIFLASTIFGGYHAGVEWGFWPGPSDCTGNYEKSKSTEDFLRQLDTVKVVRCDAVTIRVLGLSLAVWNAVVSALLAAIAMTGLLKRGGNAATNTRKTA